ncbi:hypothetical protein Fleli_0551 [Bernardetia litoralis DSM 6794]|uniref:Uncharacterized protein n=1 Tax=Bernardetia litoralis (strain ATCC 23117 / DSM 6794 / NBRC 15988 / NCIMB 1366 / Fx l1 / Sio-4) TaxID=880071 RepID=I4AGD3_BERLS|nr:hypothetical protein [Bernardetia litoralis]AFM03018.1 hypothetical protein Fleli_0551 [Bernardetia litoralis DSM 6794]
MNHFTNNFDTASTKIATRNLEADTNKINKNVRILSLGFIFSVFLVLFLSLSFSSQAQNADKNKHLTTFQDKTYIGLATEDDVEIIYTQCGEPISTFYFDVSNGEPMFVMAGLYDIMMYQLVSVKKENNKYVLTYNDTNGQKQVAQLEADSNNEKIYIIFEGMKMGFTLKEKMSVYKISNDCEEMQLASPNKKE